MDASRIGHRRKVIALAGACCALMLLVGFSLHYAGSTHGQVAPAKTSSPAPLVVSTHNPPIRVNLTVIAAKQIELTIEGQYRVIVPGTTRILAHGERLAQTNVTATNSSIRIGTSEFRINQIEIVPVSSPSLWIGTHQYRGSVRLIRVAEEKLLAVNVVPMEDYLASVVNGEMPASFARSAREAQAIVARTYALSQMVGHPQFDLYATTRSQKYNGFQYRDADSKRLAGESASSREVVRETAGIVVTDRGRIFTTYYTAACGGSTINGRSVFEDAAAPHRSVKCDWCKDATLYRWQTSIDRAKGEQLIREHFKAQGQTLGPLVSITAATRPAGDLPFYVISDGRTKREIAGTTLRRVLPYSVLYAPHFTAGFTASEIRFSGRGHGHGVGLCQCGADGLGKAGRTAPEIIRTYYPGSGLVRLRAAVSGAGSSAVGDRQAN